MRLPHTMSSGFARALRAALVLALCTLTTACSKFYWTKPGASAQDFESKERVCLRQDTKAEYRECMQTAGWMRVKASYPPPTDRYLGYPDAHGWAFRP